MGGLVSNEILKYETEIVWLEDPNKLNWVREAQVDFCTREGISDTDKPRFKYHTIDPNEDTIVGYANLHENTPPSFCDDDGTPYFDRRIFTLRAYDRPSNPEYTWGTDCPIEAVDPLTVEPQTKGLSPKKKSQIAVRIPPSLLRKLDSHVKRTGLSKTEVVVSALANYLDSVEDVPLIQRIVKLEERVAVLEGDASL